MLEEKNKATLDRALRKLPVYNPPSSLWNSIAGQLEEEEAALHLKASLDRLPAYEPPAQVWQNIEAALKEDITGEPAIKRRLSRREYAAIAAAALLLVIAVAGSRLFSGQPEVRITVVESQEPILTTPTRPDWNDDEPLFRQMVDLLASHPLISEKPEFRNLQEELDELDEARSDIEKMIKNYGNDPELIRHMAAIERERSEVLKHMVAMN